MPSKKGKNQPKANQPPAGKPTKKKEAENQPKADDVLAEKPAKNDTEPKATPGITNQLITDEVQESYLDYAMSVIVARDLPSA